MPIGGSANCSSNVCPNRVTSPPMGTMAKARKAGMIVRYGASLKTNRSALSGIRSSLKKSLMPSARVWAIPNGPGPVRPDPALHVRDHLALEPDHQHDRHHQGAEDHQHLDEDDEQHDPAHALGVEGVGAEQRGQQVDGRGHGVSIRRSTTGKAWSIRSATVPSPSGTLKSAATICAGQRRIGLDGHDRLGRGRTQSHRAAGGHARARRGPGG